MKGVESHSAEAKARSSNRLTDPDGIHKSFWQGKQRGCIAVLAWSWLIVLALQMNMWLSDFVR